MVFFISSRICPNQAKLGMKYTLFIKRLGKTELLLYLVLEKVIISFGNLRVSRLTNFKNSTFSSGQGVVQINPNSVWSVNSVLRV